MENVNPPDKYNRMANRRHTQWNAAATSWNQMNKQAASKCLCLQAEKKPNKSNEIYNNTSKRSNNVWTKKKTLAEK